MKKGIKFHDSDLVSKLKKPLRDTVSYGTALTWTLLLPVWKAFTSTWNQLYASDTSRNHDFRETVLCGVLFSWFQWAMWKKAPSFMIQAFPDLKNLKGTQSAMGPHGPGHYFCQFEKPLPQPEIKSMHRIHLEICFSPAFVSFHPWSFTENLILGKLLPILLHYFIILG